MMRHVLLSFSVVSLLLGSKAMAQSKKELAARDTALEVRIERLESQLLTGDPAAERLMQRMDALESEQRNLTGEVERLRYERDNLRAEIQALSDDIRAIETLATRTRIHLDAVDMMAQTPGQIPYGAGMVPGAPGAVADGTYPDGGYNGGVYQGPTPPLPGGKLSGPPAYVYDGAPNAGQTMPMQGGAVQGGASQGHMAPGGNQPSSVPEAPVFKQIPLPAQAEYERLIKLPTEGQNKLLKGDFSGAQQDFQTYLGAMPEADNAGEVHYWLGETYYAQGAFPNAADAYIASMRAQPSGVKAPDAMVKLAAALRELGKVSESCQTLDSFPVQYPNASAATREKARVESARSGC